MCKTCGCPASGSTELKLMVKGYAAGKVKPVEKSLLGLPGVYHVHIHAHDGETTINYNPNLTSLAEITAVLGGFGLQADL